MTCTGEPSSLALEYVSDAISHSFISADDHQPMTGTSSTPLAAALGAAAQDFAERNPASAMLAARAATVMPGGNTRTSLWYDPFPLYMASGQGGRLTDVDGHDYRDFLNEFTSGIFGHSPPVLRTALLEAFDRGLSLSSHHALEIELAAEICGRFASIDRLRFTNSGTEASLMAIAAAKLFTGREAIIVAEGGYHGTGITFGHDVPAGSLPHRFVVVPYNDIDALTAAVAEHQSDLAAILIEPMLGAGGCIPGTPAFLSAAQQLCRDQGALFILDEVQTARLAVGGRQSQLGLTPDLTTLGKFFGGGLAFGCFGGRADIMEMFDPRRDNGVAHSGTFNNNSLAMATGLAACRTLLGAETLADLNGKGDRLRERLTACFERHVAPFHVSGLGSIMNIHPHGDAATVAAWRKLLFFDLVERGFYFAPRGLVVLSLVTTDDDIAAFLAAMDSALEARADLFDHVCLDGAVTT